MSFEPCFGKKKKSVKTKNRKWTFNGKKLNHRKTIRLDGLIKLDYNDSYTLVRGTFDSQTKLEDELCDLAKLEKNGHLKVVFVDFTKKQVVVTYPIGFTALHKGVFIK